MPSPTSAPLVLEHRTQARALVEIPITVVVRGHPEPLRGQTLDISWGGVLFTLAEPLPKTNHAVQISLPRGGRQPISAEAHILRSTLLADGRALFAARFASLLPQDHKRLERLLKLLMKGGAAGSRPTPDALVRTLVVNANDSQELRHMLNEIATGRHQVTVFESYEVGQSIAFSLAGTNEAEELSLRARVVEISDSAIPGAEWAHLHDITVEFEHPLDAIRALIHHARRIILPDTDSKDVATSPSLTRGQPCAIEAQFPALMDTLTTVWSDPAAFGQLLQVLLVGNLSQPGGWPQEVWAELIFLQNLHHGMYQPG